MIRRPPKPHTHRPPYGRDDPEYRAWCQGCHAICVGRLWSRDEELYHEAFETACPSTLCPRCKALRPVLPAVRAS